MRKFKIALILIAVSILVLSCGSKSKNTSQTAEVILKEVETAENLFNWEGTYEGILPCADCEGIKTELTITNDREYILSIHYLTEKNDGPRESAEGKILWEENNIRLLGSGTFDSSSYFKVEKDQLRYLDVNGEEVTGELADKYILKKKK